MINKLTIKNFQSHKFTELNLSPGVNVIIGSSDTGKSVIIRALNWLLYNNPLVHKQSSIDKFRSHWGGDTKVIAELMNGDESIIVKRVKTNKDNYYQVGDEKFAAIKTEFPEPVKKLLNVSDLNIQQQIDSPFLLDSITSSKVAEYLNQVVNLEIIDTTLTNINQKIRGLTSDINSIETAIDGDTETLDSLNWVELAEADLNALESLELAFDNTVSNELTLKNLISDIEKANYALEDYENVDTSYDECCNLLDQAETYEILSESFEDLNDLIVEVKEIENNINRYKNIDTGLSECLELLGEVSIFEKESIAFDDLSELEIEIKNVDQGIRDKDQEIILLENEYENLKPDECPLCGRPSI